MNWPGRPIQIAHSRPTRPYGSDIARLFERCPEIAADPEMFEILAWYVEYGGANESRVTDSSKNADISSIDDLLNEAARLQSIGINVVRSRAAEALGHVLWKATEAIEKSWSLLERRVIEEELTSVRCCLIGALTPLYNNDRERCAIAVTDLCRGSGVWTNGLALSAKEKAWLSLALPNERLPGVAKGWLVQLSQAIEWFGRWKQAEFTGDDQADLLSPLLTPKGLRLTMHLVAGVPKIGEALICRLLTCTHQTPRLVGAWHIFRMSFQDSRYWALADILFKRGVVYRRLAADVASQAISWAEHRLRAEKVVTTCFHDPDLKVRQKAAEVFRNIRSEEFEANRDLARRYIESPAFGKGSYGFFQILKTATCRVDDLVILVAERLMLTHKQGENENTHHVMEFHQLREILREEYSASDGNPEVRRRFLDLIDEMLLLDIYGANELAGAHERL